MVGPCFWLAHTVARVCDGNGINIHVGDDDRYLALYRPPFDLNDAETRYRRVNGLNHIGIVVDDLDAIETRVRAEGFETYSHDNYEPG